MGKKFFLGMAVEKVHSKSDWIVDSAPLADLAGEESETVVEAVSEKPQEVLVETETEVPVVETPATETLVEAAPEVSQEVVATKSSKKKTKKTVAEEAPVEVAPEVAETVEIKSE
jgi:hypothetical protein